MLQLTERRRAMLRAMGVALAPARPERDGAPAAAHANSQRQTPAPASTEPLAPAPEIDEGRPPPMPLPEPADRADAALPIQRAAVVTQPSPADAGPAAAASLAPDWLVVGEALAVAAADAEPSDEEKLLDNMLRAVGRSRAAGAKRGARYFALAGAERAGAGATDGADEVLARLRAAARAAPSCSLLVLGRAAAAALLGSEQPLGALRGRLHAWEGCRVVVTFSLAYLLRHPAEKGKAWADLCLAAQDVELSRV